MTTLNAPTTDLASLRRDVEGRLDRFGRRARARLALEGAARVLALAVGLALLSFVLDFTFRLGLTARLLFLAAAVIFLAFEAWRHVVTPLQLNLDPVDLATALDRRTTGVAALAPRVASILQLPELLNDPAPPSAAMVERAVIRSHESLRALEFDQRLDPRRLYFTAAVIALAFVVPVALVAAGPSLAGLWATRWFLGSQQPWPQSTYLQVAGLEDGRLLVPRGEAAVLRAGVRPGSIDPPTINLTTRQGKGKKSTAPMSHFGAGDWRYDLAPLQSPTTVWLAGGDDELGPFTIEPIDRPRVVGLELRSRHPTQPGPETRSFSGQEADLAFLPKTELELTFTANVPVAEVVLRSSQPVPSPSALRRLSDRQFAVGWTHEGPVQLQIELVGAQGRLASLPLPVAIGLKTDAAPRVSLTYSGVRQRVTPTARIPLNVQAKDDYGLARVELTTRAEALDASSGQASTHDGVITLLGESATQPATTRASATTTTAEAVDPAHPGELPREVQRPHTLNVASENLKPGALLSVAGRATDACYTGAQTGQSRAVTFRVVAPEELFREILLRQQAERAKFRKLIDEARKLRDALSTANAPESVNPLAKQHRQHQREAARVATSLAESLAEMRNNNLGGEEAYTLMENAIISPLRKLADGPMAQQRDALDALARAENPQQLSDAGTRQEQILAAMKDILKQMSQWDSFVDVINQLNEIIKLQEGVKSGTEKLRSTQEESVFEK